MNAPLLVDIVEVDAMESSLEFKLRLRFSPDVELASFMASNLREGMTGFWGGGC